MSETSLGPTRTRSGGMRAAWQVCLLLSLAGVLACRPPRAGTRADVVEPAADPGGETPSTEASQQWPERDLPAFVFRRLDLTSFRNSTGPRRGPGQRFFSDLGIPLTDSTETEATSEADGWLYFITVLGRRDFNGDGVEDVAICFTDQARNGGTYSTRDPMLLQLVGGRVVAIKFEIDLDPEAVNCSATRD